MLRKLKLWMGSRLPRFDKTKFDLIMKKLTKPVVAITISIVVLTLTVFMTHDIVVRHYEFDTGVKLTSNEFQCLTENIYYEAGNQPLVGKIAVGYVTINRLFDGNFPSNVCKVVYERAKVCQFSWTCNTRPKFNQAQWLESERAAKFIAEKYNQAHDPTMGALYYHANYVKPYWKNVTKTVTIEDHIFYK